MSKPKRPSWLPEADWPADPVEARALAAYLEETREDDWYDDIRAKAWREGWKAARNARIRAMVDEAIRRVRTGGDASGPRLRCGIFRLMDCDPLGDDENCDSCKAGVPF